MRASVREQILQLNAEFYQRFAQAFSDTRGRIQPGVLRAIQSVPEDHAILDLGCGNGNLAQALSQRGHRGRYLGLDSSHALLDAARSQSTHLQAQFMIADLADPSWPDPIEGIFPWIVAFAVLHHIPDSDLRVRIMKQTHAMLHPRGSLILSCWNFLASERLRGRIVPWDQTGLSEEMVDPGDYLLDWRRGGTGLRYVHAFTESSMCALADQAGFKVVQSYTSDGKGGNLGLYQQWQSI